MANTEEEMNNVFFSEVLSIVSDIGSDIRLEQYRDAERKIELLDTLLKALMQK